MPGLRGRKGRFRDAESLSHHSTEDEPGGASRTHGTAGCGWRGRQGGQSKLLKLSLLDARTVLVR